MIALDTNVLVRYIVCDDAAQSAAATRLIERECTPADPGWIDAVVLCELVWVLESAYDYARDIVAQVVQTLLTSSELRVESAEIAWTALRAYQSGTADYADCLIGLRNAKAGCEATVTFDKKAARMTAHRLLKG